MGVKANIRSFRFIRCYSKYNVSTGKSVLCRVTCPLASVTALQICDY